MKESLTEKVKTITDQAPQLSDEAFLELHDNPIKFLLSAAKLGVKGVKKALIMIILFAVMNFIFFSLSIVVYALSSFSEPQMFAILKITVAGLTGIAIAGYIGYNYVVVDAFKFIYEKNTKTVKTLCGYFILYAADLFKNNIKAKDENVQKAVDISKIINDKFAKAPKILRKILNFIFKKIPFSNMIMEIKELILSGDEEKATNALFEKVNTFILESIFGGNSLKKAYITLLIVFLVNSIFLLRIF